MSNYNVIDRYCSSDYSQKNPSWDREDSPWKAGLVFDALRRAGIEPERIAEVGCGAGDILVELRSRYPGSKLFGFDIAPDASSFWKAHSAVDVTFTLGDFIQNESDHFDVILLLDVIEHLADPFDFLTRIKARGDCFVFHFPLDLSSLSVLRETPLLHVRQKVGHLHYFTKMLALALLDECGFDVLNWRYSGAAFNAPRRSWKTRLAGVARRILYALNKDFGVRVLGGETLIVVAKPRIC